MIRTLTTTLAAAGLSAMALLAAPTAALAQDAEIREMSLGAEDAPITVVEYASFTCPHCANFHETTFDEIKRDYIDTGKVRFVYREVYFDRPGLWASMVARCGTGEEWFFGMADTFYSKQKDWLASGDPATIASRLRGYGKAAGLTDTEVEACLTDAAKAEALYAWFQENAKADGIDSTPSFVIDGEKHGNMGYDDFAEILDEKLGS